MSTNNNGTPSLSSSSSTLSPKMTTTPPVSREKEVVSSAANEGLWNGLLTFIPMASTVYMATIRSPTFRARTNMQSRTAMVIMPPLFVYSLTSELRISDQMREHRTEHQHAHDTVQWAHNEQQRAAQIALQLANEQQQQQQQDLLKQSTKSQDQNDDDDEQQQLELDMQALTRMYQQSVEDSGVNIIPGDTLSTHHIAANYLMEHPFRVLAAISIPAVAYIFYGQSNTSQANFIMKLLHTRIFGQFATISMLLGVMALKEYMDSNGKYITQASADARVEEMHRIRTQFLNKLEEQNANEQAIKKARIEATMKRS